MHWWGVALLGLALQGIPLASGVSRPVGTIVLMGSYALLGSFAWVNRRLPAVWLVMIGLASNLVVIGVNGGMPVSAEALETAGARAEGLVGTGTLEAPPDGPERHPDATRRRDRDPAADQRRDLDRRRAALRGDRDPGGRRHARTVG